MTGDMTREMEAAPSRWVELDGVVNMRDVGGLPTRDGRRLASGRLLRSDNLQDLSADDVHRLVHDFGVHHVVDLRTATERELEGPGPLEAQAGVEVRPLSFYRDHDESLPERRRADEAGEVDVDELDDDVLLPWQRADAAGSPEHDPATSVYVGYLDARPDSVVRALRTIADSPGAVLVHCAAGKDRTGVLVALALHLVGVEPEAIMADYLLTGERVAAVIGRLEQTPTYADNLRGRPLSSHLPRREALEEVFAELEDAHGGLERWLRRHGWQDDDTERLRRRMLDPRAADTTG